MGLTVQIHKLCICITKPFVKRLVGVEALVVPFVESRKSSLRAVSDDEEPVAADLKGLDVIRLGNLGNLNVLELCELALVFIKLVDVGTTKELSNDDKHLVLDDHRLAANYGLT